MNERSCNGYRRIPKPYTSCRALAALLSFVGLTS
jgi:hypothetical protein